MAATEVTLIPTVGVAILVSTPEVAAAANSGFRFLATGGAVDSGVSTNVRWGLSLRSSPREDIMASLFEFPQTTPIVDVFLVEILQVEPS